MFGKSSKSSKKNSNEIRCRCKERVPTTSPMYDDLENCPGCDEFSKTLVNLNQKYLNLRRQREELYRLLGGTYRVARVRVEMDKYFVQHDEYLRGLNELHSAAKKRYPIVDILRDWQEAVAAITTRLNEHHNKIKEMFLRKKRLAEQEKQVTFEKSSVSSFTSVAGEEESLGASNVVDLQPKTNQDVRPKNSTPLETESSEKRNSEHLDSQVTPKSASKSYLDAEEAAHVEMRRKERQRESVEKRAELKRKKMQIEFERAQREYEERMKKLDEETQLQIMKAELGTL